MHLFQCYDPAFYQFTHANGERTAAQTGVEAFAVNGPAQIMADDDIGHSRLLSGCRSGLEHLVKDSPFEGIDAFFLGFCFQPLHIFLVVFLFVLFDDSLFCLIFQAPDPQSGSLHQGVQHKSNKFVPRNNTRVAPRLSNIQKILNHPRHASFCTV